MQCKQWSLLQGFVFHYPTENRPGDSYELVLKNEMYRGWICGIQRKGKN